MRKSGKRVWKELVKLGGCVGENGIATNLGLFVADTGVNNHVLTRNPVDGGGDATDTSVSILQCLGLNQNSPVFVTGLERVNDTEDLSGVASSGCGVGHDKTDSLLGVDDEDGADGECDSLRVDVAHVLVVNHVVGVGDLALLIADDGEGQAAPRDLVDVLDPAHVRVDGVGRETDHLDIALGELRLELGEGAELGGADGSVVWRYSMSDIMKYGQRNSVS